MNVPHRIEVLEKKHKELHIRVEALEAENAPDEYVTKLKKEKLAIKDEIEKLSNWPWEDSGLENMI
jgi:hypothetical protein